MTEMVSLSTYDGTDRDVHFTEYLLNKANRPAGKVFKSGYSFLDKKLGGIQTGEVMVITGHTKNGKTLFAESWVKKILDTDREAKALIFSFETSPETMMVKHVGNPDLQIYLPLELKTMNFEWLKARCLEGYLKYGCRVILLDHLHYLIDMAEKQNMSLNIGAFVRRLRYEIAIGFNMAIILLAHQGQPKDDKEAGLGTIRDSSMVAQESDGVLAINRFKDYNQVDLLDLRAKIGDPRVDELLCNKIIPDPEENFDEQFSMQLATISIECARRSGAFRIKKLFQKRGEYFEEV